MEIITQISHKEALDFILPRHYLGRAPTIAYAFGWIIDNKLVAVCTIGKPATPFLCTGICGPDLADKVYELNRLVRVDDLKQPLSIFVSTVLRSLREENLIVVAYSDMAMNHHGYIYQATNFIYTGHTIKRTDQYIEGKHARHVYNKYGKIRQVRSVKHRYVYFTCSSKKIKKEYLSKLNYPVLPYPKGDNANYELGTVLQPELVITP